MKKIFSLVIALMAAFAINADNYYLGGINSSWPEPGSNADYQLTGTGDELSATFARINNGSELKVFVGEGWAGNEWAAAVSGDKIVPNGAAYTLAQPAAGNLGIDLAEGHYLTNATITYNTTTHAMTLTGTDVDGSAEPDVYCLVGGCTDNWNATAAIEFADVNGVLTANIPDLNGTFKIIKNHQWGWEATAPSGTKIDGNNPFTLCFGGDNIAFQNPFAGYKNAVLTLDVTNAEAPVLTLVSGEFYVFDANWYVPSTQFGWNINETTQMTAVAGATNTYEYLAAEFSGDFKLVYGNWAIEYGVAKEDTISKWAINSTMDLVTPCNNIYAATEDSYTDVTITIVVDYLAATVKMTIASEGAAVENVDIDLKAVKRIENGQLVIEKDGVKYNALGTVVE